MAAVVSDQPSFRVTADDELDAADRRVSHRRRRSADDLAVERFLRRLGHYRNLLTRYDLLRADWLLAFRADFRKILRNRPQGGIESFLAASPLDHPSFGIAIWLLGRCASRQTSEVLDQLPVDEDVRLRRHYVRALHRVESWPRLRQIARRHPGDPYVKRLLRRNSLDTFARRVSRFAQHVDRSYESDAAMASRMPLWFRDTEWIETPPKDPSWIRELLERIKRWVRGE
ncbi:hypothetical protein [Aeoliella sp. SH292]|uniref:hypothetical protein n=1 Tax=Aeoliella sp. SH292 TaxID=3454464 RepID=UPI003F9E07D8